MDQTSHELPALSTRPRRLNAGVALFSTEVPSQSSPTSLLRSSRRRSQPVPPVRFHQPPPPIAIPSFSSGQPVLDSTRPGRRSFVIPTVSAPSRYPSNRSNLVRASSSPQTSSSLSAPSDSSNKRGIGAVSLSFPKKRRALKLPKSSNLPRGPVSSIRDDW